MCFAKGTNVIVLTPSYDAVLAVHMIACADSDHNFDPWLECIETYGTYLVSENS